MSWGASASVKIDRHIVGQDAPGFHLLETPGRVGPDAFAGRQADRNARHCRPYRHQGTGGSVRLERLSPIAVARMNMQLGDAGGDDLRRIVRQFLGAERDFWMILTRAGAIETGLQHGQSPTGVPIKLVPSLTKWNRLYKYPCPSSSWQSSIPRTGISAFAPAGCAWISSQPSAIASICPSIVGVRPRIWRAGAHKRALVPELRYRKRGQIGAGAPVARSAVPPDYGRTRRHAGQILAISRSSMQRPACPPLAPQLRAIGRPHGWISAVAL